MLQSMLHVVQACRIRAPRPWSNATDVGCDWLGDGTTGCELEARCGVAHRVLVTDADPSAVRRQHARCGVLQHVTLL